MSANRDASLIRATGCEDTERGFLPIQEMVPLDWDRLQAYLRNLGHVLDLTNYPRQFAGGFGNLNYLIDMDGGEYVLRRPPRGPIPPGANDMAREHRVLSALWRRYPWAPKTILYCADPSVVGAHFLIMQYRPGVIIRDSLPANLDAQTVGGHLAKELVGLLVALHQIEPEGLGLGDFGKPVGFLRRTTEGWAKRALLAADASPRRVVSELVDWLRANQVPDGSPTLIHCDFKLDNVVFDPRSLEARAVLDWDMATRGDPLFDLATLLSYWTEADDPQPMHDLRQMPTARSGFPRRHEIVGAYASRTGRDLSNFIFYRVLAMFKLGVVFLQLYARYRAGTTHDERFAAFEDLGYDLLEFAHEIAHGRAF